MSDSTTNPNETGSDQTGQQMAKDPADAPARTRPAVARNAAASEEAAVMNSRLARQQAAEARAIADAEERADPEEEKARAEAQAAIEKAHKEAAKLGAADLSKSTVILDATAIKNQRIADAKALVPQLQMDKTRPGGQYLVDGKLVNANGQPIRG